MIKLTKRFGVFHEDEDCSVNRIFPDDSFETEQEALDFLSSKVDEISALQTYLILPVWARFE